jgi:hypothetical protein
VIQDANRCQPERRLEPTCARGREHVAVEKEPAKGGAVPIFVLGTPREGAMQCNGGECCGLEEWVARSQARVNEADDRGARRRGGNLVGQPCEILEVGELVAAQVRLGDGVEQGNLVEFCESVDDRAVSGDTGHEHPRDRIAERVEPAAFELAHARLSFFEPVGPHGGVFGEPQVDVDGDCLVTGLVEAAKQPLAYAVTGVEGPEAVDRVEEVLIACRRRLRLGVGVVVARSGVVGVELKRALDGALAVQGQTALEGGHLTVAREHDRGMLVAGIEDGQAAHAKPGFGNLAVEVEAQHELWIELWSLGLTGLQRGEGVVGL